MKDATRVSKCMLGIHGEFMAMKQAERAMQIWQILVAAAHRARRTFFSLLMVASLSSAGAVQPLATAIDPKAARLVADGVVGDVIAQRNEALFERMESVLQASTTPSALPSVLKPIMAYGGRPLEADFKAADEGTKLYLDGTRKPLLKFWYAVQTTKSEKGTYFMFVEVVSDGKRLAWTNFSIVSFFNGVPEHLK